MSLPLCRFYSLNQTCRFGEHCRYSHSQRPPPLLLEDNLENEASVKKPVEAYIPVTTRKDTSDCTLTQNEESVKVTQSAGEVSSKVDSDNTESFQNAERAVKPQQEQVPKPAHKAACHFFARNGTCRYGRDCRFSHQLSSNRRKYNKSNIPPRFRKSEGKCEDNPSQNEDIPTDSTISNVKDEETGQKTRGESLNPKKAPQKGVARGERNTPYEKRVCSFFKSGRCNWGTRCRFQHPFDDLSTEAEEGRNRDEHKSHGHGEKEGSQKSSTRKPVGRPVTKPLGLKQIFTYAEVDEIGSDKLRASEIAAIKKRFPRDKIHVEENENTFSARILFSPTDPDWPFDVSVFALLFVLPLDYPKKMLTCQLPTDQDLPETVRRYVEITIREWLDKKAEQNASSGKVELVFRPFLRWLDRIIEEMTTEALKQLKRELVARAAGMEFISAEKLQDKFRVKSESSDGDHDGSQSGNDDEDESSEEDDESSEETESSSDAEEDKNRQSLDLDPTQKGTEISLRHLNLKENAGSLIFQKLRLILQCERCKNHSELTVPQGKVMSIRCGKCNHNQFVNYRAALIHQFSSIVGYLDVDGCMAFDLIFQDCQAVVTCMACSKFTTINGLVTGQPVNGWCQACNAKFKVAMEAVKFSQLVPSGIDTSVNKVVEVAPTKTKKPPKDPAIREGYPLPEFGTCKHYKHSYRWLRFPCCGKAYPCDVCHDKKEDHEMELANRMICGHCCKEQNFTPSRPCNSCSQHLTKIRSAHWEGGSGCRDKISMSRNDKQKHRNNSKTISNSKKKAQAGGKLKKNTKLRHS